MIEIDISLLNMDDSWDFILCIGINMSANIYILVVDMHENFHYNLKAIIILLCGKEQITARWKDDDEFISGNNKSDTKSQENSTHFMTDIATFFWTDLEKMWPVSFILVQKNCFTNYNNQ